MKSFDFYLPGGKEVFFESKGRKYKVAPFNPQEAEYFLHYLTDNTSALTKLVNVAIQNPLARALCFISYDSLIKKKEEVVRFTPVYIPFDVFTLFVTPSKDLTPFRSILSDLFQYCSLLP